MSIEHQLNNNPAQAGGKRPNHVADQLPMHDEENDQLLPPVILQYWHTILRWRVVLLTIVGTSLAIGVVVTVLTAPLYTAKAEIEISRQQKKVTNVEGLDAVGSSQDLEFYATQYALLKGTSLAERISKSLKLTDFPKFFAAHGAKMPDAPEERKRIATALLLKNVSVDPIRTSRLVDISYTSRSPQLSAQISNAWVQEFISATTDREFASTAQARRFLESRLGGLRAKMEQSEQSAVNYASANGIVALETNRRADGISETAKTLSSAELEQLNSALLSARTDRITAQARAQSGRADVSSDLLGNASFGNIKQERAKIAGDYAKILSQFEPGYPAARALKVQIDQLDATIAKETARFGAERTQSYQQALAREHILQIQVDSAKIQLEKQNHASIQYNIYQRDADTNKQLYDGLLQRYKEIAEAGDVGASNIAIVDQAEVPNKPSSPQLHVNLAIALVIGFGLAALTVFALEQIDEGIRSPADVRRLLKLPLLGNVPFIKTKVRAALDDPKSIISEAYLSVHSNLAFSTTHGLPRSLAVSSTHQAEGKSTSALAIAQIIGRTGRTVVLIDGDMRSPSIHELVNTLNTSGLSNILTGDDDLIEHVRESSERGLSVLTSGPIPPNPAELLSSERLAHIIELLLERFDHVVIDAPPMLGLADAPLICRAVEGCVFIAQPGGAPVRSIQAALQRLRFVGVHIFGVVITKIDINRQQYGYNDGYGYGE